LQQGFRGQTFMSEALLLSFLLGLTRTLTQGLGAGVARVCFREGEGDRAPSASMEGAAQAPSLGLRAGRVARKNRENAERGLGCSSVCSRPHTALNVCLL